MTDKCFLSANDHTAAACQEQKNKCVTPLKRHNRAVSYTVSISGGGGGGGRRRRRIEPRRGLIRSAELQPEGSTSSAERKSNSHSRQVQSRWSPEGRRKTEVDRGQIRSPLTLIPADSTGRNWAQSAAREHSRVAGERREIGEMNGGRGEKVSIRQSLDLKQTRGGESLIGSHAELHTHWFCCRRSVEFRTHV